MQVWPSPAVPRVTGRSFAWSALAPTTHAPKVLTARVGEEDVRRQIESLESSHEATRMNREDTQIGVVIDRDQEIDVLGSGLGRRDRTEERDAANPGRSADLMDESHGLAEQPFANVCPHGLTLSLSSNRDERRLQ